MEVYIFEREFCPNNGAYSHKFIQGVFSSFQSAQNALHSSIQSDIRSFRVYGYPTIKSEVDTDVETVLYCADYKEFSVLYVVSRYILRK